MAEGNCPCPAGCNTALRSLPSLRPTGADILASVQTRSDAASSLRPRSIKAPMLWEAHLLHRCSVSMATYRFLGARASCRHTHATCTAARWPSGLRPPQLHRLTSDVGHMWLRQDLFACLSPLIIPLRSLRLQRGVVGEVCCPLLPPLSIVFFFFLDCSRATFMVHATTA